MIIISDIREIRSNFLRNQIKKIECARVLLIPWYILQKIVINLPALHIWVNRLDFDACEMDDNSNGYRSNAFNAIMFTN